MRRNSAYAILITGLVVFTLALGACSGSSPEPTSTPSQDEPHVEAPTEVLTEAPTEESTDIPTEEPTTAPPTSLSGESLLRVRCTECHTLDRVESAQKTKDEWDTTVTRMIRKGAFLTDEEIAVLLEFLAETYGP